MVILTISRLNDYKNLKDYYIIILGLLFLILGLYKLFNSFESAYVIIFSLSLILEGIFYIKRHLNKTYHLVYVILISLYGFILGYNILFIPINNISDYLFIVAFPFALIYVSLSYLTRYKDQEMPCKNE
jgi:uncharacterized membrane protein HdeD (DUF308 family)